MADETKDFKTLIEGQKELLEEQKRTTRAAMSVEEREAADAEEAAARDLALLDHQVEQRSWLKTISNKLTLGLLFSKKSGSEEAEGKLEEGAFRKRFGGWMKSSAKFLGTLAENSTKAVTSKLPSLKTLLMTGGLAALLYFLRSPYFEKVKKFVVDELLPILAYLWDDIIKPIGAWIKDSLVSFFVNFGSFIKDPSWDNAKTLLFDNAGVLASIVTLLALKTFGISGMLTGLGLVSTGLKKAWGSKLIGGAIKKALPFIGPAAIIAGLAWAVYDGIMGYFKSDEWGVSKVAGFFGGFFGGTGEGGFSVKGMGTNAAKWALIGAGLGSFIPIVGTASGGAIGAIIGAVLGYFGGEKIAKGLQKFGIWLGKQWDNMLLTFKQIPKDIWNWYDKKFSKDPGAAMTELWNKLVKDFTNLGTWIFDNSVKPAWKWIKGIIGWKEGDEQKIKTFGMDMLGLVEEGLGKIWIVVKELFSGMFDIDWLASVKKLIPDFMFKAPIIGAKLADWLGIREGMGVNRNPNEELGVSMMQLGAQNSWEKVKENERIARELLKTPRLLEGSERLSIAQISRDITDASKKDSLTVPQTPLTGWAAHPQYLAILKSN